MDIRNEAQLNISYLYNSFKKHPDQSKYLLNILDVLIQVYKKMETAKNPEVWINRLVNYIYSEGWSRINLSRDEEKTLIELGDMSKRAGLNGMNRANFTDKSQFYSLFEEVPVR